MHVSNLRRKVRDNDDVKYQKWYSLFPRNLRKVFFLNTKPRHPRTRKSSPVVYGNHRDNWKEFDSLVRKLKPLWVFKQETKARLNLIIISLLHFVAQNELATIWAHENSRFLEALGTSRHWYFRALNTWMLQLALSIYYSDEYIHEHCPWCSRRTTGSTYWRTTLMQDNLTSSKDQ